MTTSTRAANSAEQASSLLEAWRGSDIHRIQFEFDRTMALCSSPAGASEEAERRELLEGIVQQMRQSFSQGQTGPGSDAEELGVCVNLLRHLTRCS